MGLAFGYAGSATSEGVNVSLLFGATYYCWRIRRLLWISAPKKQQHMAWHRRGSE
jgi:hypothetical protein